MQEEKRRLSKQGGGLLCAADPLQALLQADMPSDPLLCLCRHTLLDISPLLQDAGAAIVDDSFLRCFQVLRDADADVAWGIWHDAQQCLCAAGRIHRAMELECLPVPAVVHRPVDALPHTLPSAVSGLRQRCGSQVSCSGPRLLGMQATAPARRLLGFLHVLLHRPPCAAGGTPALPVPQPAAPEGHAEVAGCMARVPPSAGSSWRGAWCSSSARSSWPAGRGSSNTTAQGQCPAPTGCGSATTRA